MGGAERDETGKRGAKGQEAGSPLLGDEDAPANEVAAPFRLLQAVVHEAQVQEEACTHLTQLAGRHCTCMEHRWGETCQKTCFIFKDSAVLKTTARFHMTTPKQARSPSRRSSTMERLLRKASSACRRLSRDWSDSKRNRKVRPMVASARCSSAASRTERASSR